MSETIHVKGLRAFARQFPRDMKKLESRMKAARFKAAKRAAPKIRKRAPKAFGELAESTQAYERGSTGHPSVSVDAPHAGAVERGSPPHKPNFERLLAWVKLRGMQGLTARGNVRRRFNKAMGPTTPAQASRVASMFKGLVKRAKSGPKSKQGLIRHFFEGGKVKDGDFGHGRHLPIDAPVQVALAISRSIEKHGTKPHWFVRDSLPDCRDLLADELKKAAKSIQAPAMRVKDREILQII